MGSTVSPSGLVPIIPPWKWLHNHNYCYKMDTTSISAMSTSPTTNCRHRRQGSYFTSRLVPALQLCKPAHKISSLSLITLCFALFCHNDAEHGWQPPSLWPSSNYPWTLRYYDMNIYLWALHKMGISRISNTVWRVVSSMTLQMQAELQMHSSKGEGVALPTTGRSAAVLGSRRKSHSWVPRLQLFLQVPTTHHFIWLVKKHGSKQKNSNYFYKGRVTVR